MEDREKNMSCLGGCYQRKGGRYKERVYMHMYVNGKMRPVETSLRMGGKGIKENDGRGEFN
jgi:hypothetical protein